jgi:hypothetical protein
MVNPKRIVVTEDWNTCSKFGWLKAQSHIPASQTITSAVQFK